jgi:hypothetical protein
MLEAQKTSHWDESEESIDQFKRIIWNDSLNLSIFENTEQRD